MKEQVIIHHLSDVHFGIFAACPGYGDAEDPRIEAITTKYVSQYLQYLKGLEPNRRPHFIVVSGDLASVGAISELKQAREFCYSLRKLIRDPEDGTADQRLIIVPGNHDVDWARDDGRLANFRDIFGAFQIPQRNTSVGESKSLYYNEHYGVLFWCIDSTRFSGTMDPELLKLRASVLGKLDDPGKRKDIEEAFRKIDRSDPGIVENEHINEFKAEFNKLLEEHGEAIKRAVKIAVLHHPVSLFPVAEIKKFPTTVNGGVLKETLQDKGFDLVLHGHLHHPMVFFEDLKVADKPFGLHIIAAGTLAGHTGNKKNSFNRIRIFRRNDGRFSCEVNKVESDSQAFKIAEDATIGRFYRRDDNVARLPRQFYRAMTEQQLNDATEKEQRAFESLDRELTRLVNRRYDTGYAPAWLDIYENQIKKVKRLYAVDIQGMDAWSQPIVWHYFLVQVRRLLGETGGRPPVVVSAHLHQALRRSRDNARAIRGAGDARCESIFATQFDNMRVSDTALKLPIEMARVLLWSVDELSIPEAIYVVMQHENAGIPLFFLDRSRLAARAEAWNKIEYLILATPEMTPTDADGYWYCPSDPTQDHDLALVDGNAVKTGGAPIGYPVVDFLGLLQHDSILLARDAYELRHELKQSALQEMSA